MNIEDSDANRGLSASWSIRKSLGVDGTCVVKSAGLVSRMDIDGEDIACARLLNAVVALAIKDACRQPLKSEKELCKNIDADAIEALDFLFGAGRIFELYANLIGLDPQEIRAALLAPMKSKRHSMDGGFTTKMHAAINTRHRWSKYRKPKLDTDWD